MVLSMFFERGLQKKSFFRGSTFSEQWQRNSRNAVRTFWHRYVHATAVHDMTRSILPCESPSIIIIVVVAVFVVSSKCTQANRPDLWNTAGRAPTTAVTFSPPAGPCRERTNVAMESRWQFALYNPLSLCGLPRPQHVAECRADVVPCLGTRLRASA